MNWRNRLTAILSQAQAGRHLARRGDVERLGTVLEDTVSQAQRAANILDRLRRWSKPNRAPSEACSVHEAAQSVQNLLALEAKTKGAASPCRCTAIPSLSMPTRLSWNRLCSIWCATRLMPRTLHRSRSARMSKVARSYLDVSDNGPGVPERLKPRIFEPFVTGKPDGTGLGLALCQRLVEEMGGEIMLVGRRCQTTFRLSLPLSNQDGGTMSNHVYLVDDDEAVRNALSLLLETVGLNVRSFASPETFLAKRRT